MKTYQSYLLPVLTMAAFAPCAWAETKVVVRHVAAGDAPHVVIHKEMSAPAEKVNVTYLGVVTGPVDRTLSSQLGLPRDTGLVVGNVMKTSPAAELLKRDDVLTKLDDQILIDTRQLRALVRARKEGEEVKLTLLREGKEMSVKVKLGTYEIPKGDNAFFDRGGGTGAADWQSFMTPENIQGLARLHGLPGMGDGNARDVLRMIEHERGQIFAGPGVRIIARAGKGSTILDLPKSNISYADDDGSIDIRVDDGKRSLTVKNAKGEVAFSGPINTEEERAKLPAEVKKRLEVLDKDTFEFEVDKDFKPETVPLPPEPAKTKISRELGGAAGRTPRAF